nr:acetyltransferase [Vibrio mimicus]
MVTVVVVEFSVMRCQPLRRALVLSRKSNERVVFIGRS